MLRIVIASVLLLLICSSLQAAGVHRWVDAEGNVHFSDKPPKNQSSERVKIRPASANSDPHYQERLKRQQYYLESQQEERLEKQQLKEKKQAAADRELQICQRSKQKLARFERGRARLYSTRADGSRYYLDNNEKQARLTELRKNIKIYCK